MHVRIPKTLDNPVRAVGVPIDTLMVLMSIWSSLVMFNQGLWGVVGGVIGAVVFGRFRSRSMMRKLIRWVYWYCPAEMHFIAGVQGHQRVLQCK